MCLHMHRNPGPLVTMHTLIQQRADPGNLRFQSASRPWGLLVPGRGGEYGGLRTGPGSQDTPRMRAGVITLVTATESLAQPPGRDVWVFSGLLL